MSKSYSDHITAVGFLIEKLNDIEAVYFISEVECYIDQRKYIEVKNQPIPIRIAPSIIHDMYTCDVDYSACDTHKPEQVNFRQFFENLQIGDSIEFEFYAIRKDTTYKDRATIQNLTDYPLYINTYDHYQRLPHSPESIKFLRKQFRTQRRKHFIQTIKRTWDIIRSTPEKFTAYFKKTDKFWFLIIGIILPLIVYFFGKQEWIASIIKLLK